MRSNQRENAKVDVESGDEVDPLENIYAHKQRLYTLITLGFLVCLSFTMSVVAFMQGVVIRQVVNTTVTIAMFTCLVVLYRHQALLRWPIYVAVLFAHILTTNGFITNGGVSFYAVSILPVVPMITALLLGQHAALCSLAYVLFLVIVSGVLTAFGVHPENITVSEYQPSLAVILSMVAILCAFVGFYSLMATTKLAEGQVKKHTAKLEGEIRARKQAELQVKEAALEKTQFLSAISHELRTPLNSIIGFSDRLKTLELSDRGRVCSDQISRSSGELLEKVNDLLSFTEIFFEKSTIKLNSFVIGDLFDVLRNTFLEKDVNNNALIFDIDSIKSQVVITDVTKVNKILSNIVENALKFTKDGEVIVRATIQPAGDRVLLCCDIVDNGVGIDESKMDKLFDVFTQNDMSSSRAYEGIGLGLASSYSLTSSLGGDLTVKNNPDKGCTFFLKIPVSLPSQFAQSPSRDKSPE